MFNDEVVCSDAFLEMSKSAQNLYFMLGMNGDDDGFVSSPKMIVRMINVKDRDLQELITKRFLIDFPSGIVVIKHWLIHNTIQKDRYHPTVYQDEYKMLIVKENKAYTEDKSKMDTDCIQNGTEMSHRVEEVRLEEVRLGEREENKKSSISFLEKVPEEILDQLHEKYNASKSDIQEKADELVNYCRAKGKIYKDYKSFLETALKKDFGLLTEEKRRERERNEETARIAKAMREGKEIRSPEERSNLNRIEEMKRQAGLSKEN